MGPLARGRRVLGLYIGTIAGRHDEGVTFRVAHGTPSPDPLRNGALHKGCGSLGRATGEVRLLAMALLSAVNAVGSHCEHPRRDSAQDHTARTGHSQARDRSLTAWNPTMRW